MGCARNQEADTYSALKPLTCNIRICLTIVLFPDSPAPVSEKKAEGRGQHYVSARGDRCTLDPAPGEKKRKERATDSAACYLNTLLPGSIVLHKSNTGTSEHTIEAR